jgi:hypothetical protein
LKHAVANEARLWIWNGSSVLAVRGRRLVDVMMWGRSLAVRGSGDVSIIARRINARQKSGPNSRSTGCPRRTSGVTGFLPGSSSGGKAHKRSNRK